MISVNEVIQHFDFKGEFLSVKEFGSGHINKTYIADFGTYKYILQRVNDDVFKNIDSLMENVFAVTEYLRKVIRETGGNPDRETLHYIKTKNGDKYFKSDEGDYFRAYIFVKDSICFDAADTPELFGKSGAAFGKFQRMLKDFDADKLVETIPNFHHTFWRYENEFLPAVLRTPRERLDACKEEIEFVNARKDIMRRLTDLIASGDLPLRVTHNDTKLNNVMFDEKTGECVCVIDLDTVMPGLALYDFGDSIRFGASTAAEDEADLSKVAMDLDYFKAYAEGFLREAGDALTPCEIEQLAFAAELMTLECGMRFLTDYLNGNVYFKTDYETQNLVRARNQFHLVRDMENKMSRMESIIRELV